MYRMYVRHVYRQSRLYRSGELKLTTVLQTSYDQSGEIMTNYD